MANVEMEQQQENSNQGGSSQVHAVLCGSVDRELWGKREELVLSLLRSGIDVINDEFLATKHVSSIVTSNGGSESGRKNRGKTGCKQDEALSVEVGGPRLEPEVVVTHTIHVKASKPKFKSISHLTEFLENFNDNFEKAVAEDKNSEIIREEFQKKLLCLCAKLFVGSKRNVQNWDIAIKHKLDQFHLALQLEKPAEKTT